MQTEVLFRNLLRMPTHNRIDANAIYRRMHIAHIRIVFVFKLLANMVLTLHELFACL